MSSLVGAKSDHESVTLYNGEQTEPLTNRNSPITIMATRNTVDGRGCRRV